MIPSFSHLRTLGCGFCIGVADIVPGVSGGTMAYVLGIYPRLIAALAGLAGSLWRLRRGQFRVTEFAFLLYLAVGVLLALFVCTRVFRLHELIQVYPRLCYSLFFGLIAGTCLMFFMRTSWCLPRSLLLLAAGAVSGLWLFSRIPESLPEHAWFLFLAGLGSICATLLPGVSGSYVLLLLGQYQRILSAVAHLDLQVLLPFAGGLVLGALLFSHILHWVLRMFREPALLFINGLLLVSLLQIQPFYGLAPALQALQVPAAALSILQIFGVAALAITGLALSVILHLLHERRQARLRGH